MLHVVEDQCAGQSAAMVERPLSTPGATIRSKKSDIPPGCGSQLLTNFQMPTEDITKFKRRAQLPSKRTACDGMVLLVQTG